MNSEKGNIILLTIIGVATLLVAISGATFAYVGASSKNSEASTTIEVTSGTLSVEFQDNRNIMIGTVNPGDVVVEKTFTITGILTGSSNLNYRALLNISNNTFPENTLAYSISSNNEDNNGSVITQTSEDKLIPAGTAPIVFGKGFFAGPVSQGARHTYTIIIKYVGDIPLDANLTGTINIDQNSK